MTIIADTYKKCKFKAKNYTTAIASEGAVYNYVDNLMAINTDVISNFYSFDSRDLFDSAFSEEELTIESMEAASVSFAEDWNNEDNDYWSSYL